MKTLPGSFGSRGGEPWSAKIAQANSRTKPSEIAAGQFGAVIPPSEDAMRSAIEAQVCPWCGAGPFKMLAGHTSKNHGVSTKELRLMAGMRWNESVCSPETSSSSKRNLLERDDWVDMRTRGAMASGTSKASPPEVREKRIRLFKETQKKKFEAIVATRDPEIVAMVSRGEPRYEIAEKFGLSVAHVGRIAERSGAKSDGRTSRGVRRKGERLHESAYEFAQKKKEETLKARSEQWANTSGSYSDLVRMSESLGIPAKTLRQYFKTNGLPVPDGRANRKKL